MRTANWAPARHGHMLFMGTSSNWAFGRRVLTMAHETLTGEPLPIDNLLFDGHVYDLGWDGLKENCSQEEFDFSTLPAREFALYLINSVQFRCGTLFQLYDENTFMRQFEQFHGNSDENEPMSPLWYVHYLILLAFGKAFVNFLPFDLDAAFTSTIAIIMAATIDASLVTDYNHWVQKAYAVLDEISSRGNNVALHIGSELRQLEGTLEHLRMKEGWMTMSFAVGGNSLDTTQDGADISMPPPEGASGTEFLEESPMNFGLSPGQLLELANSLDIDSFLVAMGSPEDARL
ncbi:hypothetical protein LRP88_07291 [Fusarium phalaenopsidis]